MIPLQTAVLSWHVQNFVLITVLEFRWEQKWNFYWIWILMEKTIIKWVPETYWLWQSFNHVCILCGNSTFSYTSMNATVVAVFSIHGSPVRWMIIVLIIPVISEVTYGLGVSQGCHLQLTLDADGINSDTSRSILSKYNDFFQVVHYKYNILVGNRSVTRNTLSALWILMTCGLFY